MVLMQLPGILHMANVNQQRMQEAKDKMQRTNSMSAMWKLVFGVLLRTQLLYHGLQRLRVSKYLDGGVARSNPRQASSES